MPYLIVLGLQYDQIPVMKIAKENGFSIIGVEYSQNPPGKPLCDHFYSVSYRDTNKTLSIARQHKVVGILTSGTNDAIVTVGEITEKLGLSGLYDSLETIKRATYKNLWRRCLEEHKIPVPRGFECSSFAGAITSLDQIGCPAIVKPADSSGSKGLHVIEHQGELNHTWKEALRYSAKKVVVVEKFLGHNAFAVESFVVDKKVHLIAIAERTLPSYPVCVSIGSTIPDRLSAKERTAVAETNRMAIEALKISYGPVHIDMVFDKNGVPNIVDVGPRCVGGPLGWGLIPAATGFNLPEAVFFQSIGKKIGDISIRNSKKFYTHRHLTVDIPGVLKSIDINQDLLEKYNILFYRPNIQIGDQLFPVQNSEQRYGNITAWGNTFNEARKNAENFSASIMLQYADQ